MTINQLPGLTSFGSDIYIPVTFNGADYKMHLAKKTITGTTTSSGNLNLNLSGDDNVILSVRRTDSSTGGFICSPLWYAPNDVWHVHITSNASSPAAVTSTSVTVEVVYLTLS